MKFLYCESQDGGLSSFEFGKEGPTKLLGWMEKDVMEWDLGLVRWMSAAKVGEYTDHRMGLVVRLADKPGADGA